MSPLFGKTRLILAAFYSYLGSIERNAILKIMLKILISSFIALAVSGALPSLAQNAKRQLVLNGHGEIKMAPDMAIVDFSVESQGLTAKAALDTNTKNMVALLGMLKSSGIEDKDIQTSNFTVQPRYDDKPNVSPPKIVDYVVNNAVSAEVRKLDDLGPLLDKAVTAGANQIGNISFTVAAPQAAQDDARRGAVKDALRKANLLTEAAGVKLGALQSISESGGNFIAPMAKVARLQAVGMAAAATSAPVAQGQVSISADVNMVWELQ